MHSVLFTPPCQTKITLYVIKHLQWKLFESMSYKYQPFGSSGNFKNDTEHSTYWLCQIENFDSESSMCKMIYLAIQRSGMF